MSSIGYQRPVQKKQYQGQLTDVLQQDDEVGTVQKKTLDPLDAFILTGVLSAKECDQLVENTEAMCYSFWNASDPERKDFRNADTVEVQDANLADRIWKRIKDLVVPEVCITEDELRWERGLQGTWKAVGVNPILLFARYGPGGHFSPHTDGYTIIDLNNRSLYTLLLYLNTCESGGATRMFIPSSDDGERSYEQDKGGRMRWAEENVVGQADVKVGNALAFYQNIPHEGEPVGAGCAKYIIRTDIMYQVRGALAHSFTMFAHQLALDLYFVTWHICFDNYVYQGRFFFAQESKRT